MKAETIVSKSKGGHNQVLKVRNLSKPCHKRQAILRHTLYDPLEMTQVRTAIDLGNLAIGPQVYYADDRTMVMQSFESDMRSLLQDKVLSSSSLSILRRMEGPLWHLLNHVASQGFIATDMKPENIVWRKMLTNSSSQTNEEVHVRLIDFDDQFFIKIPSRQRDGEIQLFFMVVLLLFHIGEAHVRQLLWTRFYESLQKSFERLQYDRMFRVRVMTIYKKTDMAFMLQHYFEIDTFDEFCDTIEHFVDDVVVQIKT